MGMVRSPGEHVLSLRVGGRRREALVVVPEACSANPAQPRPLVLVFHGAGSTGRLAAIATGFTEKAQREGFFAVYPEGVRPNPDRRASFLRNPPFFNVGSNIGYAERAGIDDRGFVRALVAELRRRLPVDPRRIYATGFSNGASMAFLAAMELPEQIAAIGPVAGHLWRFSPAPTRPVPMIYIIGTADPLNPMEGGVVRSPWGRDEPRPPVARSVRTWVRWVGADPEPRLVSETAGVRRVRFEGGPNGADVEFITIAGAGHVWPGGPDILAERIAGKSTDKLDATETIWDFFSRHPAPAARDADPAEPRPT